MRAIAMGFLAGLLSACSMHMELPPGFLRLTGSESGDVRAVTGEDARIWVREFPAGYAADMQFWITALLDELRDNRGYQIEVVGAVQDGAGNAGQLLEGEVQLAGQRCGYLLAVFPVDGGLFAGPTLRTVEFVAPRADYDARQAAVRAALATLR